MNRRVYRCNVTRRHARNIVYTPGWYIGGAILNLLFIPAAVGLVIILGGPLLYQLGA